MKAATQTQPNKTANVPNSTSKVSSEDKKKMKEKKAQEKVSQTIKEKEAQAAKELAARYAKVRFDYKDPKQLSEGEIMIVIEHSDDPGRVLMSTSHDYEKYKRIASKIRTWIMRDFPSMKVIMKPNNHKVSFSSVYFALECILTVG
jgi:hypothetical protein